MSVNALNPINNGGDPFGNGRKLFELDVSGPFYTQNYLFNAAEAGLIEKKTLSGATSYDGYMFAADENSDELIAGDLISGSQAETEKYTITLEENPQKKAFTTSQSKVRTTHYAGSVLQQQGVAIGEILARRIDQHLFATGVRAARSAAVIKNGVTIHNGGNRVTQTNGTTITTAYPRSTTGVGRFVDDLAQLNYLMDLDEIPSGPENRTAFVDPWIYNILTAVDSSNGIAAAYFNRDFVNPGINDYLMHRIMVVENVNIVPVNNRLPTGVKSSGPVQSQGNFERDGDGLPAVLMLARDPMRSAVGYAEVEGGLRTVFEQDNKRGTWFQLGEIQYGMGIADGRMAAAIELTA